MNETETKSENAVKPAVSNENILAAVAYFFAPVLAAIIYLIEKDKKDKSEYVLFHAKQGIVLGVALLLVWIVLSIIALIPIIGWIFGFLAGTIFMLVEIILWLFMAYKAYSGEKYKLPVINEYAEKYLK